MAVRNFTVEQAAHTVQYTVIHFDMPPCNCEICELKRVTLALKDAEIALKDLREGHICFTTETKA